MTIITEYPLWYLFFCLAFGTLCAFILYNRDKRLSELSLLLKRTMAFFRFAVISCLAFLLLNPLLKTIFRQVEKPIIVIAQDNSESLLIGKDSAYYKNEYRGNMENLINDLSAKYDVKTYSFGDKISNNINFSFSEKQTDISALFEEIHTRYSNRNVGAIILASDGIYNRGFNPVYGGRKINAPVYTIALGDTNVRKDIVLTKVVHNRLAYLGNTFPIEVVMDAWQCIGSQTRLTVSRAGKTLFTKLINITGNSFNTTIPIQLEAGETGIQRYKVRLSAIEDEISKSNNSQEIFIDVLDSRQKILILASAPHPDISALSQAIGMNENYEVDFFLANEFHGPIDAFNLIILHQLPSINNAGSNLLSDIVKSDIPVLYILGARSALKSFNNLKVGLNISGSNNKFNEVQGIVKNDFTLFTLDDNTRRFIEKLPPLLAPFGNYKSIRSNNTMLYQRIGMVETEQPLIVFNSMGGTKTAIIAGEGIWKWRLYDYAAHNNHDIFNELVSKIVQYLALQVDKSFFRVICKNDFYENEPVLFDAEVYNESYELINEPEVTMIMINSDNKRFPYTFSKTSNAYRLNAGMFPVGEYRYEARVKTGNKILTEKGEFSISPIQVEFVNTVADHQLLYNLARKHDGSMVYASNLADLLGLIGDRDDIKSISFTQKRLKELINLKWVFFLLLILLSAEWFLRKRNGAY